MGVGGPGGLYGKVYILRLGHRPQRDKRITSHVALVARAFGANGFILEGVCDEAVERTIDRVSRCWGGRLYYRCGVDGVRFIEEWRRGGGQVIHLTMYGVPLREVLGEVKSSPSPKLVVVGAEKVDPIYYRVSDYNVSIGTQPHSEVAALAILLDRLLDGAWERMEFPDARLRIIPSPRGKHVIGDC